MARVHHWGRNTGPPILHRIAAHHMTPHTARQSPRQGHIWQLRGADNRLDIPGFHGREPLSNAGRSKLPLKCQNLCSTASHMVSRSNDFDVNAPCPPQLSHAGPCKKPPCGGAQGGQVGLDRHIQVTAFGSANEVTGTGGTWGTRKTNPGYVRNLWSRLRIWQTSNAGSAKARDQAACLRDAMW